MLKDILHITDNVSEGNSVTDRKSLLQNIIKGIVVLTPIGLAKSVKAQQEDTDRINDALNVIIRSTHLIANYYSTGLKHPTLIRNRSLFSEMLNDLQGHIRYIQHEVAYRGGKPDDAEQYDFTGGNGSFTGPFKEALIDYNKYLEIAQVMEDMATASFKAQVGNFTTNSRVMKNAYNIHSINSRHSAAIRLLRKEQGANIQTWITKPEHQTSYPEFSEVYKQEEDITWEDFPNLQLKVNDVLIHQIPEAFDKAFSTAQVIEFIKLFRVL